MDVTTNYNGTSMYIKSEIPSLKVISVYSKDGNLIKQWTGNFVICYDTENQIKFKDINNKSVTISSGIIIIEEV